jgi:hypothetical protein
MFSGIDDFFPAVCNVVRYGNGHPRGLFSLGIEFIYIPSILEDNRFFTHEGGFNVIVFKMGQLGVLFGVHIIFKQVHPPVAIRKEIYIVSVPHGDDVLGFVIDDGSGFVGVEIMNPDVISHTTPVMLPVSEFTEKR